MSQAHPNPPRFASSEVAPSPVRTAPGGSPLVGHVPRFLHDRLGFLTSCADTDAAAVRLSLGGDTYLLLDTQDIRYVLETNQANYDKSPRMVSARGRRLSRYGLLTARGAEHLEKRRTLQPLYSARALAPMADVIVREVAGAIAAWQEGQEIDAASEMMDLAHLVNGRILFSADYHGPDAALAAAIRIRRRFIQHVFGSLLPLPEHHPTPLRLAFHRAQRLIDRDVRARVAQRRAEPERHHDLLGHLVAVMDDGDAHEEAVIAAITGYETIGEALAWSCLLIAQHPDAHQAAHEQVRSVLNGRLPTAEDLPRLPYVDQVASEAMRLYPPTWIYVRVARQSDRLPSGADVPAGTRIYLCPWVIHRSARYFDDPLRFCPERFRTEARASRPRYAYFPFGGGPRLCIGQVLARQQIVLTLATLLQRFWLELVPGQTITPDPKITLHPRPGIRIRLARAD